MKGKGNLSHTEFEELSNIYVSTFLLENAKQLDVYISYISNLRYAQKR
jgi:hypothetical protein